MLCERVKRGEFISYEEYSALQKCNPLLSLSSNSKKASEFQIPKIASYLGMDDNSEVTEAELAEHMLKDKYQEVQVISHEYLDEPALFLQTFG